MNTVHPSEKPETNRKMQLKHKIRTANVKVIAIVVAAVLVFGALASAVLYFGTKDRAPKSSIQTASNTEEKNGGRFPVYFSGGEICDVQPIGKVVCAMTKGALSFVKPGGKVYGTSVLSFAEPVLKTCENYGIAYDRLSGRYALFNSKKILLNGQSETRAQITTAAVGKNGAFAVACRGDESASLLTYYNKKGQVLFSWACAKEHIVSIDISSDGRQLICAALSAEGGEIITKLYLLDIYETDTQWEYLLEDTAVIDCFFTARGRVIAVCSDRRLVLNPAKNELVSSFDYPSDLLCCSSDPRYGTAIATLKFGAFDVYEVTLLDNENRVLFTFETKEHIKDLDCHRTRVALLTDHAVRLLSGGNGAVLKKANGMEIGVCVHDASVYSFTDSALWQN